MPHSSDSIEPTESQSSPLVYLFYSILTICAIFLSFKCNNGFDITGFLGAILIPYIYLPYKLATTGPTYCGLK